MDTDSAEEKRLRLYERRKIEVMMFRAISKSLEIMLSYPFVTYDKYSLSPYFLDAMKRVHNTMVSEIYGEMERIDNER